MSTISEARSDELTEYVVLLDEAGRPIGRQPKADVHSDLTPLHLAFSLHLFNDAGEVLLTRRALTKLTWPGVWTNTCCGHPGPDEPYVDAIDRRLGAELGLGSDDLVGELRCVLPDFAYRAVDASGVVENEVCPVYAGRLHPDAVISPNNAEVLDWAWVPWPDAVAALHATPFAFSPWAVEQVGLLRSRDVDPTG